MPSAKVSNTLKRLARRLFDEEDQQQAFIQSLVQPVTFPVAVVWLDESERPASGFATLPRPEWLPTYIDLVDIAERPGRHPLHDQGAFYCLDPSSVFMSLSLTAIDERMSGVVLDACASPGGKSILSWRALRPDLLVSNEVIGKRVGALISNLKRCQIQPATVLSADTKALAEQAAQAADVVVVDAPCSGQSMIARGKDSPGCFHPATINMNANRQRRILANSSRVVRPGGFLAYMTCTFSLKENERNLEWFLKKHPKFQCIEVPLLEQFQSQFSDSPYYRMWPESGQGAGGFTVLLQRSDDDSQENGCFSRFSPRWQQPVNGEPAS